MDALQVGMNKMQLFHEIYGLYYHLVAQIIDEAIDRQNNASSGMTSNRVIQILRTADGAYNECISNIERELFKKPTTDRTWNLLDADGRTHIKNRTDRPLTTLEKRWLRTLLDDPRIGLFLPDLDFMKEELRNIEPLWAPGLIQAFDKASDADPYDDVDYRNRFNRILNAIHENKWLDLTIHKKDRLEETMRFLPKKLEYSPKDDKFRVDGIVGQQQKTLDLARMSSCAVSMDQSGDRNLPDSEKKQLKTLGLEIYDEFNTLARLLIELSNYEKTDIKAVGELKYYLKLRYREDDADELRIRLLGFGPHVKVIEPTEFVDEMRRCIRAQKIPL